SDLEKSATTTEKGFKGLTGALESFGAVLGGIVGAAVITSFAKDIIATNTQLYYLSQNLGMSAQKLNAWGLMAKQVGGSSASIQGFFSQIRGMYGQLVTGQTPALLPLFARLGINYNQSPDAIMEQLAQKFQPFDKGPNRWKAASFLEASGLSDPVVNMVLQGPAWVKSHEKQLTALSPTDRQIQQSAMMTQKIVSVEAAVNKVGNNLLSSIMPALNRAANAVSSILSWLISHGKTTEALAGAGVGLMGIGALLGTFRILGGALSALGAAFAAIDAPILLVTAAIAALGIGLYEAYKHWPAIKTEAKKVENKVAPAFHAAKSWAEGEWSKVERKIAQAEGYFSSSPNIPKTAHNPGDILYGSFAREHGATGFIAAQGGKKVAVFPNDATGKRAMDALLNTKGYRGLSDEQTIARWQTGRNPLLDGMIDATKVPLMVGASHSVSHSHTDNSKSVHINTMNVNRSGKDGGSSPSMANGMDWLLAPQFNGGLF
ncbi:MAG: hypothetical protein ACYCOU_23975, partial [Sulfobacillus sp.]